MSNALHQRKTTLPAPAHDAHFEVGIIPPAERRCLNCQTPMQGPYCLQCGQNEKSSVRHFGLLVRDIIDDVLNLDSRAVRTMKPLLLSPGFLTTEYLQGRRMQFVPPLRLYVIASLLFFFVLGAVIPRDVFKANFSNINEDSADEIALALQQMQDSPELKQLPQGKKLNELLALAKKQQQWSQEDRDVFARNMRNYVRETQIKAFADAINAVADREEAPDAVKPASVPETSTTSTIKPAATSENKPVAEPTPPNAPVPPTKKKGPRFQLFGGVTEQNSPWLYSIQERVNNRWVEMQNDPSQITTAIFSVLPQSMFIMLPIFALVLKLFYPFASRLYVEHLITAVHSHSFMFFYISFLVALEYGLNKLAPMHVYFETITNFLSVVVGFAWLWIPIYLFRMQYRVYSQGFLMTVWKFFWVGMVYTILLTMVVVIDFVVSMLRS